MHVSQYYHWHQMDVSNLSTHPCSGWTTHACLSILPLAPESKQLEPHTHVLDGPLMHVSQYYHWHQAVSNLSTHPCSGWTTHACLSILPLAPGCKQLEH